MGDSQWRRFERAICALYEADVAFRSTHDLPERSMEGNPAFTDEFGNYVAHEYGVRYWPIADIRSRHFNEIQSGRLVG